MWLVVINTFVKVNDMTHFMALTTSIRVLVLSFFYFQLYSFSQFRTVVTFATVSIYLNLSLFQNNDLNDYSDTYNVGRLKTSEKMKTEGK